MYDYEYLQGVGASKLTPETVYSYLQAVLISKRYINRYVKNGNYDSLKLTTDIASNFLGLVLQAHGVESSEDMLRFTNGELSLWRDNIENV
jgi:hypothetical protein